MRPRYHYSEALGAKKRADSPTNELCDDSMDAIVLDEDLLSIAREAQKQAKSTFIGDSSDSVALSGGPEIVTIKVHWKPHPLNGHGESTVLTFQIKRVCSFLPPPTETF